VALRLCGKSFYTMRIINYNYYGYSKTEIGVLYMDIERIKDILTEHSNAMRALFRAVRVEGDRKEKEIGLAIKHLEKLKEMQKKYDEAYLPELLTDSVDKAISALETGDLDSARETLLLMGREFDNLRKA
jgi:hypothetical protein